MSNNNINNNIQLFFNLLYHIDNQRELENEEQIILIPSLKNIINECIKSIKLKKLIQKKKHLYKVNILKKNKSIKNIKENITLSSSKKTSNLSLFNQSFIYNQNIFFSIKNELCLLKQFINRNILKIIKPIFYNTLYKKNNTIKRDNNYVLVNQSLILQKKKKKKLIKNSSLDSIFQKGRNFRIINKALTSLDNSNNMFFQQKKNIKLPNIKNINDKKNLRNRKRKVNSLPSFNYSDSLKIKYELKEKKKRDEKINFDYKGIFRLYKF